MEWLTQLPEDIRGHEAFKGMPDVGALGKAFVETQGRLSSAILPLPQDAKPEQIEAHQKQVNKFFGVPEKPEDYKINKPELPKGLSWTPELEKDLSNLRVFAHKHGASPRMAQAMVDQYVAEIAGFHTTAAKASEEAIGKLKAEHGTKYDETAGLVERTMNVLGGKEYVQLMKDTGQFHHPLVFNLFAKLAPLFNEDGSPKGGGPMPPGGGNSEKERLDRLYNHPTS